MSDKLSSVLRSALISAAGALLAYLLAAVSTGSLDLGAWGPIAATALAWAVNTLRVNFPDISPPATRLLLWGLVGASAAAIGCTPCRCDREQVQPVREAKSVRWERGRTDSTRHMYLIPSFAAIARGDKCGTYVVQLTSCRPSQVRPHEIATGYPDDVRPLLDAAAAKLGYVVDHRTMPTVDEINALPRGGL